MPLGEAEYPQARNLEWPTEYFPVFDQCASFQASSEGHANHLKITEKPEQGIISLSLLEDMQIVHEIRTFGMNFTHGNGWHQGDVRQLVDQCCTKCRIFAPPSG